MAPVRLDLQRMKKKSLESFKEYAQRWRDKATEVLATVNEQRNEIYVYE